VYCHPGPVLGSGGPGGGQAGAGHLYGNHSRGESREVCAGGSLQGFLCSPCWLFLAGEDELAGHFPVRIPGSHFPCLGSARPLNLSGSCEADVAHTLEFLSLPHETPGAHLPLRGLAQAVRAEAGHQGVVRPLRSLYLDLNLFGLLRNVQAGVIFLLLSECGAIILLSALFGAVGEIEVVRDVQTDGSFSSSSSSSLLSENSAVRVEVRLAG